MKYPYFLVFVVFLSQCSEKEIEPVYETGETIEGTNRTFPLRGIYQGSFQKAIFSPDGKFVSYRNTLDGRLDSIGFKVLEVTTGKIKYFIEGAYQNLKWSPDGNWAAFQLYGGAAIIRADGINIATITEAYGEPSWSPDNKWVILLRDEKVIKVSVPDGQITELTNGSMKASWSPKGDEIAFIRRVGEGQYFSEETWLMDVETGIEERLFEGSFNSWFKDSNRLLRLSNKGFKIFNIKEDRIESEIQLPFVITLSSDLQLSPDETRILFTNNSDSYIVNIDGFGLRKLIPYRFFFKKPKDNQLGFLTFTPSWHPDGTKIVFPYFEITEHWQAEPHLYCTICQTYGGVYSLRLLKLD